jgi:ankyrin repeat protein
MPDKELPSCPNLEQYKKQAKDMVKGFGLAHPRVLARIKRHHPRFHKLPESEIYRERFARNDAQLVLAREHGFESWPKFAKHIEQLHRIRSIASLPDPVAAFIELACAPRHSHHGSGTLEHAEMILSHYPQVAASNVHTAAILGDEAAVRRFVGSDPRSATAAGGPHGWDALTHLCFSRYLRLDPSRAQAFVETARALLNAGASAQTGWYEMIDYPDPRRTWESAIYGAAGIARNPGLTRLLLEYGADPNDEETPYHVPETYDNAVMKILLESGKLNEVSLAWMLLRKSDWHDQEGLRLLLERGASPNALTRFGDNALHHALRRDNRLSVIELLLDHAADPAIKNARDGRSGSAMAARRGRGDVLVLFERHGIPTGFHGVDRLIAACAKADREWIGVLVEKDPWLNRELIAEGGTLLAEFAGNGNVEGLRCLLDLGVSAAVPYQEGDPYFDIAKDSTALHVAAWRARPSAVRELIDRKAPVNALDAKGRSALVLAVKACVDSYWTDRRSPDSVEALLRAGASVAQLEVPSGYDEVDALLRQFSAQSGHKEW